ncbi:hypothetical protein OsccyDRAFT_1741 [Leptolyngbyaceae cyanobacterium JSC-12]|nr:hypothetical protein OsccyDRAFT_1741 [Leptolyngbyaceae cyanobacterium JSC-12]
MCYLSRLITVLGLLSANVVAFASPAIALPDSRISMAPLSRIQRFPDTRSNQLFHSLTPSASEDFFKQGQLKLEQEIRLLGKQPKLAAEDLLKVVLDADQLQDAIPSTESKDIPGQILPY